MCAVLAQSAQATKLLEGTKYITVSLVFPYIYRLIYGTLDGMLYLPWKSDGQQWMRASQIDPEVRAARKLFHADLNRRWIEEMPTEQRTELDICTLLDPRFKGYVFPGLPATFDLDVERKSAMESLKGTWVHNWKQLQVPAVINHATDPAATIITTAIATAAAKKGTSSSFFSMPLAPSDVVESDEEDVDVSDDLTKYLALPTEDNLDLDVLMWWKARDHDKKADPVTGRPEGLPHLSKMARQFLGRPASSAGVERMFSRAGRLHDDMKKGQSDETLQHSLFAAANTE